MNNRRIIILFELAVVQDASWKREQRIKWIIKFNSFLTDVAHNIEPHHNYVIFIIINSFDEYDDDDCYCDLHI